MVSLPNISEVWVELYVRHEPANKGIIETYNKWSVFGLSCFVKSL
jgi:hypothetical protein